MTARAMALGIIFFIVFLGFALGIRAGARRKMDLEQWTVGGRGFGTVLLWLLTAGEVYTAFSFLGISGWAYSRGAPVLYVLAYLCLANVVCFFIWPPVWEVARAHGLHSQPDFFAKRFNSRWLAGLVAVIGVLCIIPYLQLQLTGIGIIVEVASFGAIGRIPAMVIAVALVTAFVFGGGIRAIAWVSILKDSLMVLAALAIGITVPYVYFGGIGPMFALLARTHPSHLVMPGGTKDLGHTWFITTVFLSALGGGMWPHNFAASFTAKSGDSLRRNAIVMPLYNLSLAFMIFTGLAAILVIPGLGDGDLSLLTIARKTFPPWFLGVLGGAGALTAMVPAAIMILTASTLFAKNLYRPMLAPAMGDDHVARLARFMVPVISLVTLCFAIFSSRTLVGLLIIGYSGVTQFFPGVALGLFWKRITRWGVAAGLIVGVGLAAVLTFTDRDPFWGFNAGFLGLCANFVVTAAGSLLTSRESSGFDERVVLAAATQPESN